MVEVEVLVVVVADAFVLVVAVLVTLLAVVVVFGTARDAFPFAVFRRLLGLASDSNSLSSMSDKEDDSEPESAFELASALLVAALYSNGPKVAIGFLVLWRLVTTILMFRPNPKYLQCRNPMSFCSFPKLLLSGERVSNPNPFPKLSGAFVVLVKIAIASWQSCRCQAARPMSAAGAATAHITLTRSFQLLTVYTPFLGSHKTLSPVSFNWTMAKT